jgi:hypothetical protein
LAEPVSRATQVGGSKAAHRVCGHVLNGVGVGNECIGDDPSDKSLDISRRKVCPVKGNGAVEQR